MVAPGTSSKVDREIRLETLWAALSIVPPWEWTPWFSSPGSLTRSSMKGPLPSIWPEPKIAELHSWNPWSQSCTFWRNMSRWRTSTSFAWPGLLVAIWMREVRANASLTLWTCWTCWTVGWTRRWPRRPHGVRRVHQEVGAEGASKAESLRDDLRGTGQLEWSQAWYTEQKCWWFTDDDGNDDDDGDDGDDDYYYHYYYLRAAAPAADPGYPDCSPPKGNVSWI